MSGLIRRDLSIELETEGCGMSSGGTFSLTHPCRVSALEYCQPRWYCSDTISATGVVKVRMLEQRRCPDDIESIKG